MKVRIEWDEAKDRLNQQKHGLSFAEARELFRGSDYLEVYDAEHSEIEERFIAIGPIARGLVVIVWCEFDEDTVRIISARWASRDERERYRRFLERER